MQNSLYQDTEWALTAEARELRDLLASLGMDIDLATATLERLLPEKILYDFDKDEVEDGR